MTAVAEPKVITRRSKGEKTRAQILAAAIEILAKQGIKGTTHRAVAQHANIQLSLTTYYFKDIQELIHCAFQQNSENILSKVEDAWPQAFTYISQYAPSELTHNSTKKKLCGQLSQLATQYLYNKIVEQPVALAVEQLMFTEVQFSPELSALAKYHRSALLTPFTTLASFFTKNSPEINADLTLLVFMQLEYRHLGLNPQKIDISYLQSTVRRQLGWLMGIKQF